MKKFWTILLTIIVIILLIYAMEIIGSKLLPSGFFIIRVLMVLSSLMLASHLLSWGY